MVAATAILLYCCILYKMVAASNMVEQCYEADVSEVKSMIECFSYMYEHICEVCMNLKSMQCGVVIL